jgi:hypothetical protein
MPSVFQQTDPKGRRRWLRVKELPFSRAVVYQLINDGLLDSCIIRPTPGSKRPIRLIDGDSLDRYLEGLVKAQRPTPASNGDDKAGGLPSV